MMKTLMDQERSFDSIIKRSDLIKESASRSDCTFSESLKDLLKIKSANDYREFLRKTRASIATKVDPNVFLENKSDISLIFFILIEENCFGEVKEIKGLLIEAIKQLRQSVSYINEFQLEATAIINRKLDEIIVSIKKKDLPLTFETEMHRIHFLNCTYELFDALKFELGDQFCRNSLQYYLYFLSEMDHLLSLKVNFLLKHMELFTDCLKSFYVFLNLFGATLGETFMSILTQAVNGLKEILSYSVYLSKDVVSNVAMIKMIILIRLKKKSIESVLEEYLSPEKEVFGDNEIFIRLAIIRALAILPTNFDIVKSFTKFEGTKISTLDWIVKVCNFPDHLIKLCSFRALKVLLESCMTNESTNFLSQYPELSDLLFHLFLRNWEYPTKGLPNILEDCLKMVLKSMKPSEREKYIYSWVNDALSINVASNKRKYYILAILIDYIPPDWLPTKKQGFVYEVIYSCSDSFIASAPAFLEKLLQELFVFVKKDFISWIGYWLGIYEKCIESENFNVIKGVINNVNPIICKIDTKLVKYWMNKIMDEKKITQKNYLWLFINLLKIARQAGLIENDGNSFKLEGYKIEESLIKSFMRNGDRQVLINILEFLITSKKKTEVPSDLEYNLLLEYLETNVRTSSSDFRNVVIMLFRRFFQKIRSIFEKDIIAFGNEVVVENKKKPASVKNGFETFLAFLKRAVHIISDQLYPDASYELVQPLLEILKWIFAVFSPKEFALKKKLVFQPTKILLHIDAFTLELFEILVVNLRSSFDSIRPMSFEILEFFPPDLPFLTPEKIGYILNDSLNMVSNPINRQYESGALIINLIAENFSEIILKAGHPFFSSLCLPTPVPEFRKAELNLLFCRSLTRLLSEKFLKFEKSFLTNYMEFTANMPHGLITALSNILSSTFSNDLIIKQLHQSEALQKSYLEYFKELFLIMQEIVEFATTVSSENYSTNFFDNSSKKQAIFQEKMRIDCRGHIYMDKETHEDEKKKEEFMKKIEKMLEGSTYLDSLNVEKPEDMQNANILVVAFYLITREAGLMFQKIAQIIQISDVNYLHVIDKESLEKFTQTFFYSLLSIKHLGSIDRISEGLSILFKTIFESKRPILPNLAENLLEKVLGYLDNNELKNTLRRSAGLPFALVCLLNAEPQGRKTKLFPKTIRKLFDLANKQNEVESQIHSLNILKLIFQESSLKQDVEKYLGEGFMIAIKGFSTLDWGIRNSSLMLFSSLVKRTLGGSKTVSQHSIKSCMNVVEFFTRAPELMDFFRKEIELFVESGRSSSNMYPSIYPIALIFSRLLPYDLKNSFLNSGEKEADNDDNEQPEEVSNILGKKYVNYKEIELFLPLLIKCADNKNYMGRLMVAKAMKPFFGLENFSAQVMDIFKNEVLTSRATAAKNHNCTHGVLLQIFHVIKNYYDICEEAKMEKAQDEKQIVILEELWRKNFLLTEIKCPLVSIVYLDTIKLLMKKFGKESVLKGQKIFDQVKSYNELVLKDWLVAADTFRFEPDFGQSILRKKMIKFNMDKTSVFSFEENSPRLCIKYLSALADKYNANSRFFTEEDPEVLEIVLKKAINLLKSKGSVWDQESRREAKISLHDKLIKNEGVRKTKFSRCLSLILKAYLLLDINEGCPLFTKEEAMSLFDFLMVVEKDSSKNSHLIKNVVKTMGFLLGKNILESSSESSYQVYLTTYSHIIQKYSFSDQKDFLRISVIKSLKFSMPKVMECLRNGVLFKLFLDISRTLIRFLQDEIPEIRQRIASFICKLEWVQFIPNIKETFDLILGQKLNFNVVLRNFFGLLVQSYTDISVIKACPGNEREIFSFLLNYIFESEFYSYIKTNHIEKKIFQVDKPNKFHENYMLKRVAFQNFCDLWEKIKGDSKIGELFLKEYEAKDFQSVDLGNLKSYSEKMMDRDEYLFENITNKVYFVLLNDLISGYDKKECELPGREILLTILDKSSGFENHLKNVIKLHENHRKVSFVKS